MPTRIDRYSIGGSTTVPGKFVWQKVTGYGFPGSVKGIAVNRTTGDFFPTGPFFGNNFDFGTGAVGGFEGHGQNSTTGASADSFLKRYHSGGNWISQFQLGDTREDEVKGIAIDSAGNTILTGSFFGTVNFNPLGTAVPKTANGQTDAFVAKYNVAGELQWVKTFGGLSGDTGLAVAVDSSDNVIASVSFAGAAVDFGGIPLTSNGFFDTAIVKMAAADGAVAWAKNWGGTGNDTGYGLTVDTITDNIYVAGQTGGGSWGGTSLVAGIVVAKYSGTTGNHVWSKAFGGNQNVGLGVTFHSGINRILVCGGWRGTVDFGNGVPPLITIQEGGAFIACFEPENGNCQWAKGQGAAGDSTLCVAFDAASGHIYIGGQAGGVMDWDGDNNYDFGNGMFVISLTSSGGFRWQHRLGNNGAGGAYSIAIGALGQVLVGGQFGSGSGTVDFSGDNTSIPVSGQNTNQSAFIVAYQK